MAVIDLRDEACVGRIAQVETIDLGGEQRVQRADVEIHSGLLLSGEL